MKELTENEINMVAGGMDAHALEVMFTAAIAVVAIGVVASFGLGAFSVYAYQKWNAGN